MGMGRRLELERQYKLHRHVRLALFYKHEYWLGMRYSFIADQWEFNIFGIVTLFIHQELFDNIKYKRKGA